MIAMRKTGKRPAEDVWISHGDFVEPDWWRWAETQYSPEILVRPEDPVDRLDLRCMVGLKLFLHVTAWNDHSSRLYERLTEYADEIALMSPSFESDIGWWWHKRYGQIAWTERHWLTKLEKTEDARSIAAHRNNKPAYAAAVEEQMKILEAAPWLK